MIIADSGLSILNDEFGAILRGPGSVISFRDDGSSAAAQTRIGVWSDFAPASVATFGPRVFVGGYIPYVRSRVFSIDGSGNRQPLIVSNPTDAFDPTVPVAARGLAVDPTGTWLFSMGGDSRLYRYNLSTGVLEHNLVGMFVPGPQTHGGPNWLGVDSTGRILVADPGWGEVPEMVYEPSCFPVDDDCLRAKCGGVYYGFVQPDDWTGRRCETWPAPEGESTMGGGGWILGGAFSPGQHHAEFTAITRVDRLFDFVVDRRSDQIFATAWGTGVVRLEGMGPQVIAALAEPMAIANDRFGRLYVTDSRPALYRVDPSTGEITELTSGGYMVFPLSIAISDCTNQ